MDYDGFDYDELSRNVDDLLDDELGSAEDEFDEMDDVLLQDDLPDNSFLFRNAANSYGAGYYEPEPPMSEPEDEEYDSYDEEAAAMRYDPQTNTGAVIHAYNTDYASRAVQRAQRKSGNPTPKPQTSSGRQGETQRLPGAEQVMLQKQAIQRQQQAPRPQSRQSYQPPRPEPPAKPKAQPKKKKKKHGFLKFLLFLLILALLALAALWIFSRQPDGDSLGEHRDGCASILLVGTDIGGDRTDTMMVLYVDEEAGEMNLLSLPRDTYVNMDVSVPKLNGVYGYYGGGKDGMEQLMGYTEQCIGYRPDGYILIDLDCFEKMVDTMGGVTFDVPCDMYYEDPAQDLCIDLKAGEQKLGGKEAMWVVRFRSGYEMADLKRIEVQRDFIRAAMEQWMTPGKAWKAPAAASLITSNTTTDLSVRELSWLAKAAKKIGTDNMHTETLPGEGAYIGDGAYYVLWPETTAKLINEYFNPYYEDVSHENIYSPYY